MRGARARRAPLHPMRAPYDRHWRCFLEEPFVVGGRLRAPESALQLHLPCKHIRDWRAPNSCKGGLLLLRGAMAQWHPCLRPCYRSQQSKTGTEQPTQAVEQSLFCVYTPIPQQSAVGLSYFFNIRQQTQL